MSVLIPNSVLEDALNDWDCNYYDVDVNVTCNGNNCISIEVRET